MNTHGSGRSLPRAPTTHRPHGPHRAGGEPLRAWANAQANGDADAFTALYGACQPWVLARCRTRLSVHDAEDTCSEVFTRAWRHLSAGNTIEYPLAWLATVTRNLIIDHHKRAGRVVAVGDLTNETTAVAETRHSDPQPGPADLAACADVTPLVAAWLAELSPHAHAAVRGHLTAEDQTVTSAHAGCSLPALRSSLYRSRQRLRARLTAHGLPYPPAQRH